MPPAKKDTAKKDKPSKVDKSSNKKLMDVKNMDVDDVSPEEPEVAAQFSPVKLKMPINHPKAVCPQLCGKKIYIPFLADHLTQSCTNRYEACEFCTQQITRNVMEAHLKICPEKDVPCKFCEKKYKYKQAHLKICPEKDVPCKFCEKKYKYKQIQAHMHSCDYKLMFCYFREEGCQHRCIRKDMSTHEQENLLGHFKCLVKSLRLIKQSNEERMQKLEIEIGDRNNSTSGESMSMNDTLENE